MVYGTPLVDLFATHKNKKLLRVFSANSSILEKGRGFSIHGII